MSHSNATASTTETTTAAISLSTATSADAAFSLLPNSLEYEIQKDAGRLRVHVSTTPLKTRDGDVSSCQISHGANDEDQKDALPSSSSSSSSSIPESVLQYERQLRKHHAEQRSLTPLNSKEHLTIIHQDEDLIVVNKPSGILCVPGLNNKPNLLDLVHDHLFGKHNDNNDTTTTIIISKPHMIVHRLDMDTSGLVLFAKTRDSLKPLQAAFRDRQVDKRYRALLCGHLQSGVGDIHLPLQRDHAHPPFMRIATPRSEALAVIAVQDLQQAGYKKLIKKKPKPSHTEFQVLQHEYYRGIPVTRVELIPHTGRTHQLRVHCAAMGYPIVGDPAYGLYGEAQAFGGLDPDDANASSLKVQQELHGIIKQDKENHPMFLHAYQLSLTHPKTGQHMVWEAPTPF